MCHIFVCLHVYLFLLFLPFLYLTNTCGLFYLVLVASPCRSIVYFVLMDVKPCSLTHTLNYSLTRSLARSLTHSLTRSLARSLTHSLTRSLAHSLTCSLAHSITCVIDVLHLLRVRNKKRCKWIDFSTLCIYS